MVVYWYYIFSLQRTGSQLVSLENSKVTPFGVRSRTVK
jgi:hypothetical protein